MPKKRKNGGKRRHNRGNVRNVTCDATGKRVAKDKAIKRNFTKPLVNRLTLKDLRDASYYDRFKLPRLHVKQKFSVSEAQYHKVVRKRPKYVRKDDNIPDRVKEARVRYGRLMDTPTWVGYTAGPSWHQVMYDQPGTRRRLYRL